MSTFSTPALSATVAPEGREKPEMFLAALMRVEATYSMNKMRCVGVKVSLDASRSTGWVYCVSREGRE